LTETCLGGGEDLVRKLQFRKIADDCDPDYCPGDIDAVGDGGVDFFVMHLRVCDGIDRADEGVGRLIRTADECDDCGDDGWTLRTEAHKIEDDAGAYGACGIFALEIGDEGCEDGVWGLDDEAAEHARGSAAYVNVIVSEVGGYTGYLGLEEWQGIPAERMVGIGATFYGNDTVEGQCPDGRILVIDGLHDVRENLFYIRERCLAECLGQIEDRVEGSGAVASVGSVGAVLEQDGQRCWSLRAGWQK
jgi:hypothetical protein